VLGWTICQKLYGPTRSKASTYNCPAGKEHARPRVSANRAKKVRHMQQITNVTIACNSIDDPEAMRGFLVAALRCARFRLLLLANEIDAVGVAVTHELVTLNTAYEWLSDLDAWPFLHPEFAEDGQ